MASFVYRTFDGVMWVSQGFWWLDDARETCELRRKFQINLECVMPGQLIPLEERRDQPGKASMERFELALAPDGAQSFHTQDGAVNQLTALRRLIFPPQRLDGATGTDLCRF